jgi:transposase-like protein
MDKKCPSCGNNKEFQPTLVGEEYICEDCGTEFSEITQEVYTAPNYKKFCEGVVKNMRANVGDAIIASAIREISEGYINDGIEYSKDFIERLSGIATELYIDHKAGLREEYDFKDIMEGV